jgi:hypothetical protein
MSIGFVFAPTPTQGSMQIAQNETGAALTIVDVTGALCANAQVELANDAAKTKITGVTNADGQFQVSRLTPGTYVLTVKLRGFQTYTEKIKIKEHKLLQSTITLRIAIVGEVIEIRR